MLKLAHIVNPVNAPAGSELHRVQPVTYESIRRAKEFAGAGIGVELYAVAYPEDGPAMPEAFEKLDDLDRSVLDHGTFSKKKNLPLIGDILRRLYDGTDSEWLIYTNADICLMPQFYSTVAAMITEGHDAMLITRRRISKRYSTVAQLPMMYSEPGGPHPGFDCFVFHRSLLDRFILDNICIGVPFIEVTLLHNFIAFANNLKHADGLHLTFHIGMEVMPPVDREYYLYNRGIYENNILPKLKPLLDINKFPYASLPFHKRMTRWMLNPCYSTAMVAELEGKSIGRRIKILLDEMRWRMISGK
jgi:hypothetical protein